MCVCVQVQEFGVCEVRDLKPNGANIIVTEENKKEYVHLVCQMKMTGENLPPSHHIRVARGARRTQPVSHMLRGFRIRPILSVSCLTLWRKQWRIVLSVNLLDPNGVTPPSLQVPSVSSWPPSWRVSMRSSPRGSSPSSRSRSWSCSSPACPPSTSTTSRPTPSTTSTSPAQYR